jgi:hypothetical protein
MKRSGKTRLLEVLELLVARPWLTGRTSAAALIRKVDAEAPTLLLDESDTAFGGEKEYAETLRGVLNTGFRRSGRATLCVGQGANLTFRDFSTFSPKSIAGIGELPGTVGDRAIPIELKRKHDAEPVDRFRERDARREAQPMAEKLAGWANSAVPALRLARPALPAALHDRAQDIWEPLLAIADEAGGAWPTKARRAAVKLMGQAAEDDVALDLLTDIRGAFGDDATFLSSTTLAQKLVALDDRPWATWSKGKPITTHKVARLLKPFGVVPMSNGGTARGYFKDRFGDAWARYLDSKVSKRHNSNKTGPEVAFSECHTVSGDDTLKTEETPMNTGGNDGLTLPSPDTRASDGVDGDGTF